MNRKLFRGLLTVLALCVISCNVFAASVEDVKQNIIKQAKEMGVEPAIVLSIAKTESGALINPQKVQADTSEFFSFLTQRQNIWD